MSGWVKLHRKAKDSAVWKDADVWRLWTWMLMEASHKERQTIFRKSPVTIQRGQLLFSLSIAASETGLSIRSVRTCLTALESLGNVTVKTTNRFSIITITNWDAYQLGCLDSDKQDDKEATSKRQASDTPFLRNKKGKNEKKSLAPAREDFDVFWEAYPKKKSKADALKAWNKLNGTKPKLETLLSAIAAQKAGHDWQKDGGQFIPYPATWLTGKRWEDDLEAVEYGPSVPQGLSDEEYERMRAQA